jgi:hypothetical protein
MSYQLLLEQRGNRLQYNHLCKLTNSRSRRFAFTNFVQAASGIMQHVCHVYNSSSSSSATTSSGTSLPTNNTPTQTGGANIPCQSLSLSNQQSCLTGLNTATFNQLFILFGVKGPRRTLELAQIDTKRYTDDRTFFRDLRQKYRELRGFWRYWFSVWRLRHCDFVKVYPSQASLKSKQDL